MWIFNIIRSILLSPKTQVYAVFLLTAKLKNMLDENSLATVPGKEPLALPRGSVRALLVLILTVVIAVSYVYPDRVHIPQEVEIMWLVSVGYYLGYRSDNAPIKEIKH